MKQRFFNFIMSHRITVVVLLGAVTAILGYFAAHIQFDNSIESYFLEDDIRDYHRFLDQFGTDEIVVVAFGNEDIFTVDNFALIDALSRAIKDVPHVRRVISLTTAKTVTGRGDTVVFEDLTPSLPSTPAELAAIRARAFADPIIPETLISTGGRNTAVVAEIDHIIGEFDYKVDLLRDIRAILAEQKNKTGKSFAIGGTAVLDDAMFRYTQRDQMLFSPLMILIIALVTYSMFRSVVTTLLPLLVVVISMVWTYGFMALVGFKINIISTIIGPLLMAVGIADAMHIIADYLQEVAGDGSSRIRSIERSFLGVLGPCVITSATTALGLLSLLTADLVPIRQFGIVGAAGVMAALVVTIVLLPILLAAIPLPQATGRQRHRASLFAGFLSWLGAWKPTRAALVLVLCAVAVVPAGYSLGNLTVGTNSLDYFRRDDPVRRGTEWIDRNIGGTTSLEFLIDANGDGRLTDPDLLERMDDFQDYLKKVPGITKVFSVTDMVKTLNRAFREGKEEAFRIPASDAAVAQELLIVDGSADLNEVLASGRKQGRITARVAMNASRALAHNMPEVETRMREIFGNAATVTPTGIVYLMHRMEAYLLSTQIKSFVLAFVVITVVMMGALRSLRLGALAMIPNLLPIVFILALMPVLNISLDVGTVMIAGVALGLVIDDTTHFLYRLKEQSRSAPDTRGAIARAMNLTGRPIIFTSVALSLGFSILVLASFNPLINFGILAGMVIMLALVFDLVVLPAIVGLTSSSRHPGA